MRSAHHGGACAAGLLLVAGLAHGQPTALSPGAPLRVTIAAGETRAFSVVAARGDLVRMSIEGAGAQLRVIVDSSSEPRERVGGDREPLIWSRVVRASDTHAVHVTSLESAQARQYVLTLREQRASRAGDDAQIEAESIVESVTTALAHRSSRPEAMSQLGRAFDLATGDPDLQARASLLVARLHTDAGRTTEAERALVETRDRCRGAPTASCEGIAELRLGRLYASTGQPDRGRERLGAALRLRESQDDAAGRAEVLVELAGVDAAQARHDRARQQADRALQLARHAGDRRSEGDALNVIGLTYFNQSDPDGAGANWRLALTVRRTIGDETGAAQTMSNLGVLHNSVGESREALTFYEEALGVRRRLSNVQAIANTLHNLGVAHANLNEHDKALELFDEALGLWRSSGGRRGEAFALQAMGQSFARLGNADQALAHFDQCGPIWRAVGDRRGEAQTLLAAASVHADLAALPRALGAYDAALALAQGAELKREVGLALLGLSSVRRRQGDLVSADRGAREALALFDAIGDRRESGRAWAEIGANAVATQRWADAASALRAAVARFEAVEDRGEDAKTRIALAEVSAQLGLPDDAVTLLHTALDRFESVRTDQRADLLRLSVFAAGRPYYDRAIAVLMQLHREAPTKGYDAKAFAVSERRRARRLLDMVSAGDLQPTLTEDAALVTELRRAEELVASKTARLTRLLTTDTPGNRQQVERARSELSSLLLRIDLLRGRLRSRDPDLAELTDPVPLDLAEVRAGLDDKTLLLEYAVGDVQGVGWALSTSGFVAFDLPRQADLARTVRQAISAVTARAESRATESPDDRAARLANADATFRGLAQTLTTALFAPAAAMFRGKSRVVIVGDALLDPVPFAALPLPGSSSPLAEGRSVVILPSASVAHALAQRAARRARPSDRVAVFADPVFSTADARLATPGTAAPATSGLLRLRFSREESRQIAELAPKRSTVWADFAASRARALDGSLAGYGYIHVATHAIVDEEHPQLSTIELSRVDERGRPQEGALRLLDIYNLKLNANLVVLSACRTALGAQVAGEGLVGLASGFLRAGAAVVVASLWDVDDRAASAFMTLFYDGVLRRGLPPAQAFHLAQRAMQSDPRWAAPFDWAAWVIVGASR